MELAHFLKKQFNFNDDIIIEFDNLWETGYFSKGHQLINAGENSQKVFYVEKGLIRMYYLKDGKDITHFFFDEGTFYTSLENVFFDEYHPYYLELLEDSVIRITNYSKIEKILLEYPELNNLVRFVMVEIIKKLADRLCSIQFQTAQERYKSLIENYPNILLRSSLGNIASYLGITQQTLSVIRSEK